MLPSLPRQPARTSTTPPRLFAERSRSPAGASNASPGPVDCDVTRPLVSEHLPEILGRILHTDLVHRRFVRDVIHRPWREVLKAALMVHRVPEHLSKIHHRTDDAAIGRSGKHVRP